MQVRKYAARLIQRMKDEVEHARDLRIRDEGPGGRRYECPQQCEHGRQPDPGTHGATARRIAAPYICMALARGRRRGRSDASLKRRGGRHVSMMPGH